MLLSITLLVVCIIEEVYGDVSSQQLIPCKEGWYFYGDKCYKVFGKDKGFTWKQASTNCSLNRAQLATIQSKGLQDFLSIFLLLSAKSNLWIGLNDRGTEDRFVWEDDSEVNFTYWEENEPSRRTRHEDDCVAITFKAKKGLGSWDDVSCDSVLPYICQSNKSTEAASPDPLFCFTDIGGGWKYLNSCYHIVTEEKTWDDAENYCQETFDGHLVKILDNEGDIFLDNLLSNISANFWIGINIQEQAVEKWSSGWFVTYMKWGSDQEQHLKGTCGLKTKQNVWETTPCFHKYPFICEKSTDKPPVLKRPPGNWQCPNISKEWIDFGGEMCYYVEMKNKKNWYEANYNCAEKGGTLASIHSEEEINILGIHLANEENRVLIGAHRSFSDENVFVWADGSEMDFQHWADGEPNGKPSGKPEDCTEIWTNVMEWNDLLCNVELRYLCSVKKVPLYPTNAYGNGTNDCICQTSPNKTEITGLTKSKDYVCGSVSGETVAVILVSILLVEFLIGIILYYSLKFCSRRRNNFTKVVFSSLESDTHHKTSSEIVYKPEELECEM